MRELSSTPFIAELHLELKARAAALIDSGTDPHVAVVLVGENPDSVKYVAVKEKRSKEDGIILSLYHLLEAAPYEEIANTLQFLAADSDVHGIILQLPLPESITREQLDHLIEIIPIEKDVDGLRGDWESLTYQSPAISSLAGPQRGALPPMVLAVMSLLDHYDIDAMGKQVVLVGKGRLVGKPLEHFFHKLGVQVESVDEHTENIITITKQADILITGTGEPNLVTYQWVKEGAVVIDCSGDVHVDSVGQVAEALSPAQGGVGPLTVVWLLNNVLNAAQEASHA